MNTRNIIMVVNDLKTVVAQYSQWDGQPEAQGITILEFLHTMNFQQFSERLNNCIFTSKDQLQELGGDDTGMISDVSNEFFTKYPQLSRNIGAGILEYIYQSSGTVELQDDSDFVNKSSSCEWAYVIDLDNGVFEVYEGFQTDPVPIYNRFQSKGYKPFTGCLDTYYPVKLVQQWNLEDLPNEAQFLRSFNNDNMEKEDVFNVIDHIRLGYYGNGVISEHICNFIEANIDEFIKSYE